MIKSLFRPYFNAKADIDFDGISIEGEKWAPVQTLIMSS
jgi:hypothetical protein